MPTTIADVVSLARESIELKRKNATIFSRQRDIEAELEEIRAAVRAMRSQITAVENWIKTLKPLLSDGRVALETLRDESARTTAGFRAEMDDVVESLDAKKVHVDIINHEIETEVVKAQQLLKERRETSQTAICSLEETEDLIRDLQLKVAAMTADRNEWGDVAMLASENLKTAEADVAL